VPCIGQASFNKCCLNTTATGNSIPASKAFPTLLGYVKAINRLSSTYCSPTNVASHLKKTITFLDIAEIFVGSESGVDIARKVIKIYRALRAVYDSFDDCE
jgi:hypothetical protein